MKTFFQFAEVLNGNEDAALLSRTLARLQSEFGQFYSHQLRHYKDEAAMMEMLQLLKNFKSPVFRCISIPARANNTRDAVAALRLNRLGNSWSRSMEGAGCYYGRGMNGTNVYLQAEINPQAIDLEQSLYQNLRIPREEEIVLKSGQSIRITQAKLDKTPWESVNIQGVT